MTLWRIEAGHQLAKPEYIRVLHLVLVYIENKPRRIQRIHALIKAGDRIGVLAAIL